MPQGMQRKLDGTVVQINEKHHWFRVQYRIPGVAAVFHETFKTADPPGFLPWRQGHRSGDSRIMRELRNY